MKIRHKGLRALHERDDRSQLPASLVPRLRSILFRLQEATHPGSADAPGFRLLNPPPLGELIRESMDEVGWHVVQTAACRRWERGTLSRLLNGKAGVSANTALALEALGWSTADHWMRMQASYELAAARRARGWREDIRVNDAVPR